MSTVFDKIALGLEEAIAYEKGELEAKKTKITVEPVTEFSASEIKNIRNSAGMTQIVFANFMGVSAKTVEAWESGRNKPEGPARRIFSLLKSDPELPEKYKIIAR